MNLEYFTELEPARTLKGAAYVSRSCKIVLRVQFADRTRTPREYSIGVLDPIVPGAFEAIYARKLEELWLFIRDHEPRILGEANRLGWGIALPLSRDPFGGRIDDREDRTR